MTEGIFIKLHFLKITYSSHPALSCHRRYFSWIIHLLICQSCCTPFLPLSIWYPWRDAVLLLICQNIRWDGGGKSGNEGFNPTTLHWVRRGNFYQSKSDPNRIMCHPHFTERGIVPTLGMSLLNWSEWSESLLSSPLINFAFLLCKIPNTLWLDLTRHHYSGQVVM